MLAMRAIRIPPPAGLDLRPDVALPVRPGR